MYPKRMYAYIALATIGMVFAPLMLPTVLGWLAIAICGVLVGALPFYYYSLSLEARNLVLEDQLHAERAARYQTSE